MAGSTQLMACSALHALGWHTKASREYMAEMRQGVTQALSSRDGTFGDYRTGEPK